MNNNMQYARCPHCNAIINVDSGNLRPTLNCPACQKRKDGKDLIVIDNINGKEFYPNQSFSPFDQVAGPSISTLYDLPLPEYTHWYQSVLPTHGTLVLPTHGTLVIGDSNWPLVFFSAIISGAVFLVPGFLLISKAIHHHSPGTLTAGIFCSAIPFIILISLIILQFSRDWIEITPSTICCSHGKSTHRGLNYIDFKRDPNYTTITCINVNLPNQNIIITDNITHKSFKFNINISSFPNRQKLAEMLRTLLNADLGE